MPDKINKDIILSELDFSTSRSGGKGGQHVNKTESKVHLYFDVEASAALSEEQKERILEKGKSYISNEGILQMTCETSRSQASNKQEVVEKFFAFIHKILQKEKPRKKTKKPKKVKEKRLEEKHKQAEKKKYRKPPEPD
ncbi:MAG: alternative ribosome rescue aminoacyl-tRNA hydrolase ArfB [Bacteroidota bacterium]